MARKSNPLMEMEFHWIKSPNDLADKFGRFEIEMSKKQRKILFKLKKILVDYAKQNRPWTDRTGDARATLHANFRKQADDFGVALYHVTLSHGVHYGIFLELANSGRYAIIYPTLVANQHKIMELMVESLKESGFK